MRDPRAIDMIELGSRRKKINHERFRGMVSELSARVQRTWQCFELVCVASGGKGLMSGERATVNQYEY